MPDLMDSYRDDDVWVRPWLWLISILQACLLLVAAWHSREYLNADAVPYMRIAGYYASGQTDLMVSGYWGALISWLMVPLILAGVVPLTAAWTVMVFSAMVFLLGCMSLFRRLRLPPSGQLLGSGVAAVASIGWCTERISPDLLLTGCMLFAIGQLVSPSWVLSRRQQLISGGWLAIAYFAKAVAFPLALLLVAGFALIRFITRSCGLAPALSAFATTLICFLVCASPWLITLSLKFHRPTFSVSYGVNHSCVGPGVEPGGCRLTTFEVFHTPEPGRLSSWEDPASLPYPNWSRFGSRSNALHQLKIVKANWDFELATLRNFDVVGCGLIALLIGAALIWPANRRTIVTEPWQWTIVPVGAVLLMYMPDYGAQSRYFYLTYPCLLAAAIGLASWVSIRLPLPARPVRGTLFAMVAISFSLGVLPATLRATLGIVPAEQGAVIQARNLAERLRTARAVGPIAGEAPLGFYLSYLLSQPYHGNKPMATLADFESLQGSVKLLLLNYDNPAIADLRKAPGFHEITDDLYPAADSIRSEVAIFELSAPSRL
jgi:hypothetical protein